MAWSLGFRNLQIPGMVMPVAGMPYDHARNAICQRALEIGASHVFMLDSDIVPPHDAILRLLSYRLPIVSGLYFRRSPPHGVPVMMRPVGQWITHFKPNALIEVDVVGSGCLLIHRDVLQKLPPQSPRVGKRWFDWRVDQQGLRPKEECLSEDFTLCMHARKHGYKIMVDTGCQCRHLGLGEASYGRFEPCTVTPIT